MSAATAALTTVKQLAEIDKALSIGELKLKVASLYSDLADVRMALSDAKEALAEKDKRIVELEAGKSKAPGKSCPSCGVLDYRIVTTAPHPEFGVLGGKNVTRACGSCGFSDTDLEVPK